MRLPMDVTNSEIESQRYGRDKNSLVNHTYISGGEYRNKFDEITDNPDLVRLLYQISKEMLEHRSGTQYEDMYWIDLDTISVIAKEVDCKNKCKINYSKRTYKAIAKYDNILTIHSHPNSSPPSIDDINSNYKFGYYLGLIACHDGTIYMYSSEEEIPKKLFNMLASEFRNRGYNDNESHLLTLQKLNDEGHI